MKTSPSKSVSALSLAAYEPSHFFMGSEAEPGYNVVMGNRKNMFIAMPPERISGEVNSWFPEVFDPKRPLITKADIYDTIEVFVPHSGPEYPEEDPSNAIDVVPFIEEPPYDFETSAKGWQKYR